jgi:hypothetical protein
MMTLTLANKETSKIFLYMYNRMYDASDVVGNFQYSETCELILRFLGYIGSREPYVVTAGPQTCE